MRGLVQQNTRLPVDGTSPSSPLTHLWHHPPSPPQQFANVCAKLLRTQLTKVHPSPRSHTYAEYPPPPRFPQTPNQFPLSPTLLVTDPLPSCAPMLTGCSGSAISRAMRTTRGSTGP